MPHVPIRVDAMMVDYQCILPSVVSAAECTNTSVITTMDIAKISGATHIEFNESAASEAAGKIISVAIENFKRRKAKSLTIPDIKMPVVAGFSVEAISAALPRFDAKQPLKPLLDQIVSGNIRGVCLFAGCNNVKVPQDNNFIHRAKNCSKKMCWSWLPDVVRAP